jgi:hypothetical protein
MNSDDYAKKQSARDAEYQREYRAWVESLPADERRQLEAQGLGVPCVAHHGNGSAKGTPPTARSCAKATTRP